MQSLEVDGEDVIRIVMQFLRENKLVGTLRELQRESSVSLDAVESVDALLSDVRHGRWEAVVPQLSCVALPGSLGTSLYEQIFFELLEAREFDLAGEILRNSPLTSLATTDPQRHLELDHWVRKGAALSVRELYPPGSSKEKRREELAAAIKEQVAEVPPGRLLSLISQALKWQQLQGLLHRGERPDLFRACPKAARKDAQDKIPRKPAGLIKFGQKSHPESAIFSPDGQSLVTGSADGFIEVWDPETGRLRKDLDYQARDQLMMHDDGILCHSFTYDGELLATGCSAGTLKVWNFATGKCLRKIFKAHTDGIASAAFSRDGTQVLTGSFDSTARIHGLKSGKMLREFRGHTSYVSSTAFVADGAKIVTGSHDGNLKIWDAKTAECLVSIRPGDWASSHVEIPIHALVPFLASNGEERLLVCDRSRVLRICSLQGGLLQSMESEGTTSADFVCASMSSQSHFAYAVATDGRLYAFNVATGELEGDLDLVEEQKGANGDVLGIAHHPHRNLIATYTRGGLLKLWRG
jgi:WD40 repeat-containing protein SMU1